MAVSVSLICLLFAVVNKLDNFITEELIFLSNKGECSVELESAFLWKKKKSCLWNLLPHLWHGTESVLCTKQHEKQDSGIL